MLSILAPVQLHGVSKWVISEGNCITETIPRDPLEEASNQSWEEFNNDCTQPFINSFDATVLIGSDWKANHSWILEIISNIIYIGKDGE